MLTHLPYPLSHLISEISSPAFALKTLSTRALELSIDHLLQFHQSQVTVPSLLLLVVHFLNQVLS